MTLLTLLRKELRTRLRRERIVWLMVVYILLLGIAGWLVLNYANNQNNSMPFTAGTILYYLLANLQLALLIFITPAFTATAINGEKEHQTYDLLLCSQLSNFALVTGKMLAGMATSLLLIAASVPVFSLIFFFGGVGPAQLLEALLIYLVTALLVGSVGMLFSILFQRPAISTALAYLFNLFWCTAPAFMLMIWYSFTKQGPSAVQSAYMFLWNPFVAISNIASPGSMQIVLNNATSLNLWIGYLVVTVALATLFFITSIIVVRPATRRRGVPGEHQAIEKAKVSA